MRFPTLGAKVPVAFVLSYDVDWGNDGNLVIADAHLQSGLKQFGEPWLHGVAHVFTLKLADKLVIVGGEEQRFLDTSRRITRPDAIRSILVMRHKMDVRKIDCVVSEPNTIGNAKAISEWCFNNQYSADDAFVICAYWHIPRAALQLGIQGINMPLIPAEAIMLAYLDTREVMPWALEEYWGGGDFAKRASMECKGIAAMLRREYKPLSEREETPAAVTG